MNESSKKSMKLSADPYKGTRDFYPEDMFVLKYIMKAMSDASESFGYSEYTASPLESAELYKAKTGEEIVNEQTYTFIDRGGRSVTLRPEMTPTVARMVASRRRDLATPIRWYSIPNLFRYEQPQRGRLREHYQLNVDIFGVNTIDADAEVIALGKNILERLNATEDMYKILVNDRRIFRDLVKELSIPEEDAYALSKLIDKKEKVSGTAFRESLANLVPDNFELIIKCLSAKNIDEFINIVPENIKMSEGVTSLKQLISILKNFGINNVEFSPSLMRGFDYYTGTIFEFFDTDPSNNRSLFGGGRYDELLAIFDEPVMPAVGFGMGDVTARDFLETHNLLPKYEPSTDVYLCHAGEVKSESINAVARTLRQGDINVAIDLTQKKIGDQIKSADKQNIEYVIVIGDEEVSRQMFMLKNIVTGDETELNIDGIIEVLKK